MAGPHPAVAAVRTALSRLLDEAEPAGHLTTGAVAVACSGGADSLALAAAATHVARHRRLTVHGLVVDHRLQPGSAEVAARTATQLRALGFDSVRVIEVEVTGPGGIEAAARRARYAALDGARPPGALVLLGHTLDDQAETVLLGLGRGSGPRSVAGMRPLDPPWARPLLGLRRETTTAACAALGLRPWVDPHNADPRFTRVRLRTEVLPLLEEVLRGGVAEALARTAAQLREDCDALDRLATDLTERVRVDEELDAAALGAAPAALRRRVLRRWLGFRGVSGLTDHHLRRIDALMGSWRGQGGVALPGGLVVRRTHGRLQVDRPQHRG
ncbi:tRNA(Ile)-lysidine synthase [Longimycelium tulufanense]|uniref:tRNA(Ile)-lysidine synthase n=1 Tax=Longimycelium tulufanense TaxID=907463 RepID=A0A8J3C6Y2_9PSEU|nr:tRNA lysidine(34) synthetase TilS [Longimycelium tulufanense]GGM44902.1 tRNA(Ile)-lysidine synthase [Longimycelium tulufanense]